MSMNRHVLSFTLTEMTDSFEPSRNRIMECNTVVTTDCLKEEDGILKITKMVDNWLRLAETHYGKHISSEFKPCANPQATARNLRGLANQIEAAAFGASEVSMVNEGGYVKITFTAKNKEVADAKT